MVMKNEFGDRISDMAGVSKEIIMNIPHITLAGNREVYIENHKGILKYSEECICVMTESGILKISGRNLKIDMVRVADIFISGYFYALEFEN